MGKTVLEARVVDIEKRRFPSKHYVYVVDVVWSEGTTTTIYRRYSDFFQFQCGLLEKFPEEAGSKNPEARMIPFLPGKKLFGRSQVRSVAAKRMGPIDDYCQKLIRLPPKISDNEYVINFFEVTPEDISPVTKKEKKKKSEAISDISDPIVLDQYIVIADYKKQKNNECSITAGQIVEVIDKNENGWWFVHMDDFNEGWIPATYLETIYGSTSDGHQQVLLEAGEEEVHITTSNYQAKNADELSFERGVLLEVYLKGLDGWWKARYKGNDGFVPACFLTRYYGSISSSTSTGPTQMVSTVQAAVDSTLRTSPQASKASQSMAGHPKGPRSSKAVPKVTGISVKPGVDPYTDEPIYGPTPRKHNIKKQAVRRPSLIVIQNSPKPVLAAGSNADKEESFYEKPVSPVEDEVVADYESIPEFYMTLADFQTQVEDGLSFRAGVTVSVITKNPSGWYYVEMGDKEGWVPSSYLERTTKISTNTAVSSTDGEAKPNTTSSSMPAASVSKTTISSRVPAPTVAKTTTSRTSSQSKPAFPNKHGVSNTPLTKSRHSESELQTSSVSVLAAAISNLKTRPQDSEQNLSVRAKAPPPKPKVPTRSQGANKPARTRGSLRRSSSSDSLYETPWVPQSRRLSVSPPEFRKNPSIEVFVSTPKPSARKNVSGGSTDSTGTKAPKFLRKSQENLLASQDHEEKQSNLRPEVVPRKTTLSRAKSAENTQETSSTRPRPASRTTTQSMGTERPKPAPPPARTATSYKTQVTGTMRLAELENALQNKKSDSVAALISKSTASRKIPTRPSPLNVRKTPPKRPQLPTSASLDKSKKPPPPRPSYSPATSHKIHASYITIADYIGDESQGSLGFKEGVSVEVIEKNNDGWWFVNIKGKEGWVPSTFIEQTSGKPERPKPPRPVQLSSAKSAVKTAVKPKPPTPAKSKDTFVAIGDYTPAVYEDSGIALVAGEIYNIIEKSSEGWWFVSHGMQEGWAPSSFLEPV